MREILSVSVSSKLKRKIQKTAKKYGMSKSDLVKNAVEKYLVTIEFDTLREKSMPYARKKGYITDEDIFEDKDIS